jgi:hypothetical protein
MVATSWEVGVVMLAGQVDEAVGEAVARQRGRATGKAVVSWGTGVLEMRQQGAVAATQQPGRGAEEMTAQMEAKATVLYGSEDRQRRRLGNDDKRWSLEVAAR